MAGMSPNEAKLAILTFIVGADFVPMRLSLHTLALPANPQLVGIGDLTVPGWAGYNEQTPAWSVPAINADGNGFVDAPVVTFTRAGAGIAENVCGWFLISKDRDGNDFLTAVYWFTAPIAVSGPADQVKIIPKLYDVSPV